MKDEKGKARTTRATEKRADQHKSDGGRKSRIDETSRESGAIDVGVTREDRTGNYPSWIDSFGGGILAQLIKSTKDQLSEAEACIEWYQRKKQEALEGLQELERLKELAQQEMSPASDASDEEG